MKMNRLTTLIMIAMVLGVIVGYACNTLAGGPAAAKVVRAGAHPVKIADGAAAREVLARLQQTLIKPPPWLAKTMGVKAESLEKFAETVEE